MEHMSTLIVSFIGAASGGAIAAIGFLFRRSEETRQKYRSLQFELLGLYRVFYATKEFKPTKYVDALGEAFAELGHPEILQNAEIRKFLEPFVAPQFEAMLNELRSWDKERYLSAVRVIAPINPVLAHTFRANGMLISGLELAQEYWRDFSESLKEHGVDSAAIEPTLPVIEEGLLEHILGDLKTDIIDIGKLAGIRDSYRTKRWFHRQGQSMEKLLAPYAKQMLSKISNMQQN